MAESSVVPLLEIRDELITCEICLESFDNQDKSPRILPCFHSFCCRCLESIWEKSPTGVRCPNCRQVWPVQNTISATFPQNKVLRNLVEYLTMKNKVDEIMCYECPDSSRATMRCLDCQEFMCKGCATYHQKFAMLKDHKTIWIKELVNMPHDDYFHQTDTCKKHNSMILDLYCKNCATDICSSCVHVSHRDHEILDLKDVYEAKMDHMKTSLKDIQSSSDRAQKYTSRLSEQNATLDSMKENICKYIDDSYEQIIQKLSEKRKEMKEVVISNIETQKADRNEQMKLVGQSEVHKADHVLHCQQAVEFARAADFIEMAQTLEDKLHSVMEGPELVDIPIQEVTIDDTFKQIEKIIEKTGAIWNGIIFNNNEDEDVMKRILFPVDGQSEQYRTLLLPNIEYDAQKINRKWGSINESGILVNKPSDVKHTDQTSGLQYFRGVTARTHVPTSGCAFWETEVDCMVRESAELHKRIAGVGVCLDEHCEDTTWILNNKHARGVAVSSCKTHNSICLFPFSNGKKLCCIPVTDFKTNSRLTVTLGLLVDIDNATLHIIRVDDNTVVHSIPNIDVSRPLMPMFSVHWRKHFDVKLRVSSDTDLFVNRELLVLLSNLVK
ncbi:E3 ubiquitin-protein ligase TRIM56-like [Gigantopelta aegis]|uniref:E3 ubiquitin-protein ligase TRIM56-like n=1 Tax=Gigantopelta aegis TaxID=1735272 RepID=UPI001B88DB1C|nr:E3 ubiquitin-protein ligase TRIM56-like [Gigantopelta aegis]